MTCKPDAEAIILDRMPASAIGRTIVINPMDVERPVPMPLLATESHGIPQLAADRLVALLKYRFRELGPRSTELLTSALYALARVPGATLFDVLRLWSDASYRSFVAGHVTDDQILSGHFAWLDSLGAAERNFITAAPRNKLTPLLQRSAVANVLAGATTTFTFAEVLRERLNVIITLPEGFLGPDAMTLLGQAANSRIWAAVQARHGRSFVSVTIDEAPRFLDGPTDLGEQLARSREYGAGYTVIGQSLAQFPAGIRDIAVNSARTKVAFGTSDSDARRLADEFGPSVTPEFFSGLDRYVAIGAVSLGGTVSPPFTFKTEALAERIPGRAKAIRAASRKRWGVPREEIEAALRRTNESGPETPGPVGRRTT
jgi:hypothetical protein